MNAEQIRICSFCGVASTEVPYMMANDDVAVCENCIAVAAKTIMDDKARQEEIFQEIVEEDRKQVAVPEFVIDDYWTKENGHD